jgi:hypothetical protein
VSRDPQKALLASLAEKLGPLNALVIRTRDWSSATFTGVKYAMHFTVPWSPEVVIAVLDLPDADLPMPGHFVADLRIVQCERRDETLHVALEILTIEEA